MLSLRRLRLRATDGRRPPHRTSTIAGGAVAALLASASGCSADAMPDLPNDRIWVSAHFRYHTRNGDDGVCEAVLQQLERHFELIQAYLDFPWPMDRKVDYYKFRDGADYLNHAGCPDESGSCTSDSTVMSPFPLQDHELIHSYLAPLGLPPAFFVEGIASVLACRSTWTLDNPKPWQEVVLLPFSDRFDVYAEGPWFIGYLLYRYGPESVLSLYGSLDHETASLDQISATFEALYGESLDTVWNAALASSHYVRCVNLWRCAGATLALDGSHQTLAQACDATDLTRTFQLDAETDVVMTSGFPPIYAPVSCDQELPFAVSGNQLGAVIDPAVAPMTSGKYFVQGSTEEAATVGVRVLPKKAYAQDCTQSEPVDLSAAEFSAEYFDLTIPNGEDAWFIKLRSPNNRSIWQGQLQASANVEECIGCGDSLVCQPLNGETHPDADGIVTLRLTSETPGPGYVTYGLLLQ